MRGTLTPRVKICCISSIEEAQIAIWHGSDALGLVGHMPSGPGIIDDHIIKAIANATPPPISTFLLTSETSSTRIIDHYSQVHTSTVQIVDVLTDGDYYTIREALPHVNLVQVIHVVDESAIAQALEVAPCVDAVLLDSGNPNLAIKELGGTGRVHNWEISKTIREQLEIPIFLAGGLNPDNVKKAIEAVQPFGLDLCSGVRSNGKLDERKLESFFSEIRSVRH